MKTGAHFAQVNKIESVLKGIELLSHRVYSPVYPESPREYFRSMTYHEIWKACIKHDYYDIMLSDSSLIQINKIEKNDISYSYIESPYNALTYKQFLGEHDMHDDGLGTFQEDYENYLSTLNIKQSFAPIRYDYVPLAYREGGHPAGHIHIGHQNNIRLATKKILSITSFMLFIIRQQYPKAWVKLTELPECSILVKHVRDELADISTSCWNIKDEWEMYFA